MPSKQWKKKQINKNYYASHKHVLQTRAREHYACNRDSKKKASSVYSKAIYKQSKTTCAKKKCACTKYYRDHQDNRRDYFRAYYRANQQHIKVAQRKYYANNRDKKIVASRAWKLACSQTSKEVLC